MKIILSSLLLLFVSCAGNSGVDADKVTGSELIGGSFSMQDFNGKDVTDKTYQGKYQLIFFGFTSCQTVCPLGLSTIGRAMIKLPKKMRDQIQPLFVTVDPERDTLAVLKKYLGSFYKGFIGLRGSQSQLDHMIKKFRGYYGRVEETGEEYSFDHSDVIYLMGKDGKYLSHFSSSTGEDFIANKIKSIIK
jgi:protein SCO1/2